MHQDLKIVLKKAGVFLKYYRRNRREPWQIAASRFCLESSERGFSLDELKEFVHARYNVKDLYIGQFFEEEIQQPSGRQFSRNGDDSMSPRRYSPPLELVAKITDYDELREARNNSRNAFWFSLISVALACLSIIVSLTRGE